MRNLEIKVVLPNDYKSAFLTNELFKDALTQTDTYYDTFKYNEKLKIREEITKEGIYTVYAIRYNRENVKGEKISNYDFYIFSNKETYQRFMWVFGLSLLRVECVVKKTRHLYLYKNARIHLDSVLNLGNFLEIEIVITNDIEERESSDLMKFLKTSLNINKYETIAYGYKDMLQEKLRSTVWERVYNKFLEAYKNKQIICLRKDEELHLSVDYIDRNNSGCNSCHLEFECFDISGYYESNYEPLGRLKYSASISYYELHECKNTGGTNNEVLFKGHIEGTKQCVCHNYIGEEFLEGKLLDQWPQINKKAEIVKTHEVIKDIEYYATTNKVFWILNQDVNENLKANMTVPCIFVCKHADGQYQILQFDESISMDNFKYTAWRKLLGQVYNIYVDVILIHRNDQWRSCIYNCFTLDGKKVYFNTFIPSKGDMLHPPIHISSNYLAPFAMN